MRLLGAGYTRIAVLFGVQFIDAISILGRGINVEDSDSTIDYAAACPDYAIYATYYQYGPIIQSDFATKMFSNLCIVAQVVKGRWTSHSSVHQSIAERFRRHM